MDAAALLSRIHRCKIRRYHFPTTVGARKTLLFSVLLFFIFSFHFRFLFRFMKFLAGFVSVFLCSVSLRDRLGHEPDFFCSFFI